MNTIGISVISNRTHITLLAENILYLSLSGRKTVIHITSGRIYETYTPIDELAKKLGSTFIRADRCYLVSAKAIHDVTKTIDLINGESLDYARRRKREIVEQLRIERQKIGQTLERNDAPTSREAYHRHYVSFDHVPFAFADIEMVFSEAHSAVAWIFRYGNEALAELEKTPLEQLIDHSFGSIFPNMDAKWLRVYERTALFGETLEIEDYSPEIDTNLKIICFPTFKGHCGCMLFDRRRIQTVQSSTSEDTRAGCKHRCTDAAMEHFRAEVMELCHRENLYQIDLLHGSASRVTEREYWEKKKGQAKLDEKADALAAEGLPAKPTKFETDKEKLRKIIRKALDKAGSFDEFSSLLLQQGVIVKESRGRYSYLTPDRTKPITARKLGDDFDKTAVLAALERNALRPVNIVTKRDATRCRRICPRPDTAPAEHTE